MGDPNSHSNESRIQNLGLSYISHVDKNKEFLVNFSEDIYFDDFISSW